ADAVRDIERADPDGSLFQYADDTQAHTEPTNLTTSYRAIEARWRTAGLELNASKTKVWTPSSDTPLPPEWEPYRTSTLRCLGADLMDDNVSWTAPEHGGQGGELAASAGKISEFADNLRELRGAGLSIQLAQSLLRYAAVGGPQHVLMCKPATDAQCQSFDESLRGAWQKVLNVEL
ncbi:MAG: hypothetical protein ACPG7P_10595, partial [Candidatus Puniceispirillaceae bacterium]